MGDVVLRAEIVAEFAVIAEWMGLSRSWFQKAESFLR
jgi:hypothetical protein